MMARNKTPIRRLAIPGRLKKCPTLCVSLFFVFNDLRLKLSETVSRLVLEFARAISCSSGLQS